jgi:adenylate cyclase
MAAEIERKFLVVGDSWRGGASGRRYVQGYLSRDVERIVRVRQAGASAYLTIKGIVHGTTRPEFEHPVPFSDAETRYIVEYGGKRWEVDEFHGENQGLILAEIEFSREGEPLDIPPWIGKEVSGDPRYFNAYLSEHPYASWETK